MAEVIIDVSELTLGDVEKLSAGGELPLPEQLNILDKIVKSEGGARAIRLRDLSRVMAQVKEEVDRLANPLEETA
jgi:hypothetical protein